MEKFYLGMDIGTESVGMACTDEQYNLLRAQGKALWAVRLFDEAKDAMERYGIYAYKILPAFQKRIVL